MPDIDIDFADDRRHEVIQYVAEEYGKNFTAQIITFGTLSAKSAARDVGRVFGFESTDLDRVFENDSKQSWNHIAGRLHTFVRFERMDSVS